MLSSRFEIFIKVHRIVWLYHQLYYITTYSFFRTHHVCHDEYDRNFRGSIRRPSGPLQVGHFLCPVAPRSGDFFQGEECRLKFRVRRKSLSLPWPGLSKVWGWRGCWGRFFEVAAVGLLLCDMCSRHSGYRGPAGQARQVRQPWSKFAAARWCILVTRHLISACTWNILNELI